jgi:hypothetical protein
MTSTLRIPPDPINTDASFPDPRGYITAASDYYRLVTDPARRLQRPEATDDEVPPTPASLDIGLCTVTRASADLPESRQMPYTAATDQDRSSSREHPMQFSPSRLPARAPKPQAHPEDRNVPQRQMMQCHQPRRRYPKDRSREPAPPAPHVNGGESHATPVLR